MLAGALWEAALWVSWQINRVLCGWKGRVLPEHILPEMRLGSGEGARLPGSPFAGRSGRVQVPVAGGAPTFIDRPDVTGADSGPGDGNVVGRFTALQKCLLLHFCNCEYVLLHDRGELRLPVSQA